MSGAQVNSLEVLRHLRAALIKFSATGRETMVGLDLELRRGLQWLLDQQPQFWKSEQRRLEDRVLQARQELSRCKGMALPGEVRSCSEQKQELERALAQLRHAEEKAKLTKHWGRIVEHESREWQGRASQYAALLEAELPRAIAVLDRAIASLEAYLGIASAGPGEPRSASRTTASEPAEMFFDTTVAPTGTHVPADSADQPPSAEPPDASR